MITGSSIVAVTVADDGSGTPVWLSVLLAVLTLAGVLASAVFLRRSAKEERLSASELDRRDKREETMRTLRWAADRATSVTDRESRIGIAVLGSLGTSPWLETEDQGIIDAVVDALTAPAVEGYREVGSQAIAYEFSPDESPSPVPRADQPAADEPAADERPAGDDDG